MITITKGGIELPFKSFTFPAGEVGVKLDTSLLKYLHIPAPYQTIIARIQSSKDVMELANVRDALERFDSTPIRLFMPYTPYARQDRCCVPGESFSLKVFANLINAMKFEDVTILDPHSDVCGAVFDRVKTISQAHIISRFAEFNIRCLKGVTFVSPDAGANKKTSEIANYFSHTEFIRADKLRDLTNGNIKETIVYAGDLTGKDIVIADDLCDGGRTFVELAKVLKAKHANKVILYVTHGVFSKGFAGLFIDGIDEIYTTNSFQNFTDPLDTKVFDVIEEYVK